MGKRKGIGKKNTETGMERGKEGKQKKKERRIKVIKGGKNLLKKT